MPFIIFKKLEMKISICLFFFFSKLCYTWICKITSLYTLKDPNAGKDIRKEKKGTTEDEMAGWHHQLNGHEFEQAPRDGKGQGSLVCCSPRGHKESDTTEQLKNNNNNILEPENNSHFNWTVTTI